MPGKTTKDAIPVEGLPHLDWQKSSYSDDQGSNCVEVAVSDTQILLRDSKDPDGPMLSFTLSEWRAFVSGVKASEFDLP